MKKNIAIFGWKIGENSFGITVPYYEYFKYFGDVHILSPLADIDFSKFDLLVVPGGPDVAPNSYGMIPNMATGKSDPIREYFDKYLLPKAIQQGIPIVGICRGHQSIAVHFQSCLDQHMWHETNKTDRSELVHNLFVHTEVLPPRLALQLQDFNKGLERKRGKDSKVHPTRRYQKVNSIHHQCVLEVPTNAMLLAAYEGKQEDANTGYSIEALYYPDNNIFTFQYHPEEIWDDLSMTCISYLLNTSDDKHVEDTKSDTTVSKEIQG